MLHSFVFQCLPSIHGQRLKLIHDSGTGSYSLPTASPLHGSYAPRDPKEAAQLGNTIVVVHIPRPPRNAIDVTPRVCRAGMTRPEARQQRPELKIYTLPPYSGRAARAPLVAVPCTRRVPHFGVCGAFVVFVGTRNE